MKCHKVLNTICILLTASLLYSCAMFPDDININPNEVTEDQLQAKNYKVGANVRTLQGLVIPIEEHMYQFNECLTGCPFAGYVGASTQFESKFETYNPSADWRKWPFANVITETYAPYRAIINGTDDPVAIAFARLLKVAIMHRVTDSYGPIPYSALESSDEVYVGYDTQEQVYTMMFEELDEAISALNENITLGAEAWSSYDAVYYGNISKWIKYANSLKLRMAMRLSYVSPEISRTRAAEAIAGGVIETNEDNAQMNAAENRMTLIYNDWADHRVARDIIEYMNGYQDPRREKMFTKVEMVNQGVTELAFNGIAVGLRTVSKESAISSCSNIIVTSDTPYLWFNAAEAAFLRAEYELRWGTEAAAKEFYEKGITLSFEERGAEGVKAYIADSESVADGFGLSDITIAWQTGNTERNLERIITQKWIAIFPLGTESWCERRRTGYPVIHPVVDDLSGGTVNADEGARRLPYPAEEYALNRANVEDAIVKLDAEAPEGSRFRGDIMGTRVWWDCKNF